jgi:hypothetical protein
MTARNRRLLTNEEFLAIVAVEDPLRLTIAGHSALNRALDALLAEVLPEPEMPELARISFVTKVDLLMAMHVLWHEPRPAWRDFNQLRNEFAHDSSAQLTNERAARLRASVPSALYLPPPSGDPVDVLRVVAVVLWFQITIQLGRVRDRAAEWRHVNAELRKAFPRGLRATPDPEMVAYVERDRAERSRRGGP